MSSTGEFSGEHLGRDPVYATDGADEWPEIFERIKAESESCQRAYSEHTPTNEEVAVLGLAGVVRKRMMTVWNDAHLIEHGGFLQRRLIKRWYRDGLPGVSVEYAIDTTLPFIPPDMLLVTPWTTGTQDPQVEYRVTLKDALDFDVSWSSCRRDPALQELGLFERGPLEIEERKLDDVTERPIGRISRDLDGIYTMDTFSDPTTHWPLHDHTVKLHGALEDILRQLS